MSPGLDAVLSKFDCPVSGPVLRQLVGDLVVPGICSLPSFSSCIDVLAFQNDSTSCRPVLCDHAARSNGLDSHGGGSDTQPAGRSLAGCGVNTVCLASAGLGSNAGKDRDGDSKIVLGSGVIQELMQYFGRINPSTTDMKHWPPSVAIGWKSLVSRKSPCELGILSWNTNGRLDLRGCRESLLKRWSMKGFVDVGLIQEHFKKVGSPIFNLFGAAWWNLSSGAVGGATGRRSGGCAIFGQPCLEVGHGFQVEGGRVCGILVSGGLLLSLYFPTKKPKQPIAQYGEIYSTFVDDLIKTVGRLISGYKISWIACGADLNAHFAGSGLPPRRKDDFPAIQVRRFMSRFNLTSLAMKICPGRFTCLNSRGGVSCLDTFLVSDELYKSGAVTLYEVLDFVEHGSDHSPVYLRLKVYPSWIKRPVLPKRRILKRSGIKSLEKKLGLNSGTREEPLSR